VIWAAHPLRHHRDEHGIRYMTWRRLGQSCSALVEHEEAGLNHHWRSGRGAAVPGHAGGGHDTYTGRDDAWIQVNGVMADADHDGGGPKFWASISSFLSRQSFRTFFFRRCELSGFVRLARLREDRRALIEAAKAADHIATKADRAVGGGAIGASRLRYIQLSHPVSE